MRILKGYSKDQQKELEYTKNIMSCNDLLNNITYFPANVGCDSVKDKYDGANTDERISIIRDILDFYTDKAKFAEQEYYVHFITSNGQSYLNINQNGALQLCGRFERNGWKTKFTHEEIIAMNPQFLLFEEEVEDDE